VHLPSSRMPPDFGLKRPHNVLKSAWPKSASPKNAAIVLLLVTASFIPAGCSRAQNSGPERDRWQRPDEVMDALGVHPGSVAADVGCGKGYFALKLAERVGPEGKVYAEDIRGDVLADLDGEAARRGLKQVKTIHGQPDDPRLPPGALDVVLTVDSYHEWIDYDAMLDHLYAVLKPGGVLGLIDGVARPGKSRDDYHHLHRMPESMERGDLTRHGFKFLSAQPGFTRPHDSKQYYFLIFQKPASP
jgi:predicted methyltransferase